MTKIVSRINGAQIVQCQSDAVFISLLLLGELPFISGEQLAHQ